MARYFFDLHECGCVTTDAEGMERPSLEAVRNEAVRAARGIMCAEVDRGQLCLSCHIEVRDEAGVMVMKVAFGDLLRVTGQAH